MMTRYSDYTVEQLREEVAKLKEKVQKAEQLGQLSKVAINERKLQIVLSYMVNPEDYQAGTVYTLNGDPGHTFKINYINGVMAWGHRINLLNEMYDREEAIPLSLLEDRITEE
ncbi:YfhH family protein [Virgibacillus sp. W0430]|uniref:YfhH family protein n=1 Tax=Virgibacillus sp. W0430 TaxID=3391580 RepID=UPI003F46DE0A